MDALRTLTESGRVTAEEPPVKQIVLCTASIVKQVERQLGRSPALSHCIFELPDSMRVDVFIEVEAHLEQRVRNDDQLANFIFRHISKASLSSIDDLTSIWRTAERDGRNALESGLPQAASAQIERILIGLNSKIDGLAHSHGQRHTATTVAALSKWLQTNKNLAGLVKVNTIRVVLTAGSPILTEHTSHLP